MTAPIVNRFRRLIADSSSLFERAEYEAKLACYFARVGDFEDAERYRLTLRERYGGGEHPRVSVLLMCLDGLLHYFKDLDPRARDRLLRANLISGACGFSDLTAFTASWLAHIEFNRSNFQSMRGYIESVFENMNEDDGTSHCRVALILGDAFLYAGDIPNSQRWNTEARVQATKLGDQAAIAALTYNRAALHVSNFRMKSMTNDLIESEILMVDTEVRSASNYQSIAALVSLDHLLVTAQIGVLLLRGQFAQALVRINSVIDSKAVSEATAQFALLSADRFLCRAKTETLSAATDELESVLGLVDDGFDPDDLCLIYFSLIEGIKAAGLEADQMGLERRKSASIEEYERKLTDLRKQLNPFCVRPLSG